MDNSLPHIEKLSPLAKEKVIEIINVIIYKAELEIRTNRDMQYIDLPLIHPGYENISSADAFRAYKILDARFKDQGFAFPVQGIERTDPKASWIEFMKKLKAFGRQVTKDGSASDANAITDLKVVSPADASKKYLIVVNEDYGNPISADKAKPSWKLLYGIAENKAVNFSDDYKSSMDYFNSNRRCKLYTQTGLSVTKILEREKSVIRPNIKIELISEKALATRANSQGKAA